MKKIIVASASCILLAGCNNGNVPAPAPPPVSVNPPSNGTIPLAFPVGLGNFYSPSIIQDGGNFDMWVTILDRILRYKSTDGKRWTGGQVVMSAIAGSWEDDGGTWGGLNTGLSDPRVVKNVTPGYAYTMYYTGGKAPNTETSGGIGCAVSNDGDNWSRVGSGLLRKFPGGNCFIIQAMTIAGKRYLYYLGGGSATVGPSLWVAEDAGDGIHFANDRIVFAGANGAVTPLFYDEAAGSCWVALESPVGLPSGPIAFDIYQGSDGFNTLGTKVKTVDSSISGYPTNFDPQALQRTDKGLRSGSGQVQIIFSAGRAWAQWVPASVLIG